MNVCLQRRWLCSVSQKYQPLRLSVGRLWCKSIKPSFGWYCSERNHVVVNRCRSRKLTAEKLGENSQLRHSWVITFELHKLQWRWTQSKRIKLLHVCKTNIMYVTLKTEPIQLKMALFLVTSQFLMWRDYHPKLAQLYVIINLLLILLLRLCLSKPAVGRFGIERHAYWELHTPISVCMCVGLLLPNHWTDLHKNYTSR